TVMNDLDSRLARVLAHIDAHLDERLTARALAPIAWMSASRLEPLFRETIGRSLGRHIRERRIEAAARALRETEAPLQAIALASGFYDQAHFCRVFKSARHATPREYRYHTRAHGDRTSHRHGG
ncbi:MAG TPA: AraC family transcriptional regulator, partial [Thermoanaerobaculia bacterium]|nr:AraC family transcriptional regulator [Thermoanaerobaculia bacterium]